MSENAAPEITFGLCEINSFESIQLIKQIASLSGFLSASGKQEDYPILFKEMRRLANEKLNAELNDHISEKMKQAKTLKNQEKTL